MLFSSLTFIFLFLPICLIGYFIFSFSRKLQNMWLLIVSLVFYSWGNCKYLLLLLTSIILNYILGMLIYSSKKKGKSAKGLYCFTWISNMAIFFVFKYLNFTVDNLNILFDINIDVPEIALPLGISFFTFQGMSYVIDVYRGQVEVQKNPLYVGLYISFFPQLVAGPIVKYSTIAEQINNRKVTYQKFSVGCCRFVTGLGKKILLSNNFAIVADKIFSLNEQGEEVAALLALVGIVAYTLQIFFDFSAYSDMAIGLALMFGFSFNENFDYPYVSKSVTEFWRRWHISLTNWFREYIYIPLGGSRVSNTDKLVRNLFIVWMFTGIWHGASWNFILWGLFNFVFIFIEKFSHFENLKIPSVFKHIYLLVVIMIGWVFFRAENLTLAWQYIKSLFGAEGFYDPAAFMYIREYAVFFIAGIIFSMPVGRRMNRLLYDKKAPVANAIISTLYPVILMIMFLICVTYLVKGSYNPFIYFNF